MGSSGRPRIEKWFPNLRSVAYDITSPDSPAYNCVAWAAGDDSAWWEPTDSPQPGYHWPAGVPKTPTVDAVIEVFRVRGYEPCPDSGPEAGYEKIAVYTADGEFTHVARLLPTGRWASKLGAFEDIEHDTLDGLAGDEYGTPTHFLRRPIAPNPPP